ncbi:MAG: aminotransferase class V-fold PLP-dependent enzyme [Gluconacetobacter diazotrophicus]|nr:aminotransferase class V-fold PLP-dependent enzyme [Gluconacetobacter diazotrophicus]
MPPVTYLDANASEPLRPEAREAALAALDLFGNPSSVHSAGRAARRMLEDARDGIAACFGVDPSGVVFTSGGTEADALAIAALGSGRRVLFGATEHDAVRQAVPGGIGSGGAAAIPVSADGTLSLPALSALLDEPGAAPALVCVMAANNETGVLHPLREVAALCRARGALLHVDAVQAAGRSPVSLPGCGADSMALSGHKLGGPKGAGALLLGPQAATAFRAPLIAGGGQERGRRGGTPSLPALAGFAAAAMAACRDLAGTSERLGALRAGVEAAATRCGAVVVGGNAPRIGNTACLALPGRAALPQLIALDLAGIAVSAGAACSSGKVARSHVLDAMGLGGLADAAIRVSLPWNAVAGDVDRFAAAYERMAAAAAGRGAGS